MANDEMLTDDFVADLLSKEASDCSLKYSAMGMDAYRSNKKPSNMPKPNTRFLRHIIKGTDNHNKALLAKEAAESKARLKDLEEAEYEKRRKTNPNSQDIRKRQMGDIHAILGGGKRRRTGDDTASSTSRKSHESRGAGDETVGSSSRKSRESRRMPDREQDSSEDRHEHRRHRDRSPRELERYRVPGHRSSKSNRRRLRSPSENDDDKDRRRSRSPRRRRHRSKSPDRRRRSRSPANKETGGRKRSPAAERKSGTKEMAQDDDDSDPLDEFIGPAPPPKYRGRGTVGNSSGIGQRFSEAYDPRTDVQMDDDEARGRDWDDIVEAFRDRQKVKVAQEQRLKEAGFAEDQIKRATAAASDEKLVDSVQWSKAGERRDWDRGKVVGADGTVTSDDA